MYHSMKVVIYARVSTDEQDPLSQLYALRSYARARNWEIVGEHVDYAVSGMVKPSQREGWTKAVEQAVKEGAVLLVFSLDRISRNYGDLVFVLEELKKNNVRVASMQEEWLTAIAALPDATLSMLVYDITVRALAYAYQKYVDSLREKIKAGMEKARAEGKHVGRPPKIPPKMVMHYVARLQPQGVSIRAFWKMLRGEGYNVSYKAVCRAVRRYQRIVEKNKKQQ